MKEKIVGLVAIAVILVAAIIGTTMPVSADSSHYLMYTGQELQFYLTRGDTAEVSYYLHQTGTKWLRMWHTSYAYKWDSAICSLYWTNNWGRDWHYFTRSSAVYYIPMYTRLYSGSPNIGFKIVCESPWADVLHIHMKAS